MIKLSTGKQEFKLLLDDKEVSIYFNPTDPDLLDRMKKFYQFLKDKEKEVGEDESIGADGAAEKEEIAEKEAQLRQEFCEELDKAFCADISSALFQYCSPFAMVDGQFFLVNFLNGIIPEIKKRNKEAQKETERIINKHIKKYKR